MMVDFKNDSERDLSIAARNIKPGMAFSIPSPVEREQLNSLLKDSVTALLQVFHKHSPSGTASLPVVGMWLANLPLEMAELSLLGRTAAERKMLLGALALTIPLFIEDKLRERTDG